METANDKFVGNVTEGIPEYLSDFTTVRLGVVAYDIDGKKLPPLYRPMFIGYSELDKYDRIMMARFNSIRANHHQEN